MTECRLHQGQEDAALRGVNKFLMADETSPQIPLPSPRIACFYLCSMGQIRLPQTLQPQAHTCCTQISATCTNICRTPIHCNCCSILYHHTLVSMLFSTFLCVFSFNRLKQNMSNTSFYLLDRECMTGSGYCDLPRAWVASGSSILLLLQLQFDNSTTT